LGGQRQSSLSTDQLGGSDLGADHHFGGDVEPEIASGGALWNDHIGEEIGLHQADLQNSYHGQGFISNKDGGLLVDPGEIEPIGGRPAQYRNPIASIGMALIKSASGGQAGFGRFQDSRRSGRHRQRELGLSDGIVDGDRAGEGAIQIDIRKRGGCLNAVEPSQPGLCVPGNG